MRGLYDVIAFLSLLASPLRYQKPKWVIADLGETGNADVAEALLRAYAVSGDPAEARSAVETAFHVVEGVAAHRGLPPIETVRELGLVAEYPEYSYLCHCVDDARSLLADGRHVDAAYAAKFSIRMALAMSEGGPRATFDRVEHGRAETHPLGPIDLGSLVESAVANDITRSPVTESDLELCLAHLERCKSRLFSVTGSS